jgi:hypothetical protein
MKLALMSVELLRSQLVIPVSDRVPQLNVEVTCKATEATDKAMGLAEAQSFTDCMRDESTAQQQLNSIWPTSSGSVRDRCENGGHSGHRPSYVDLLTCLQMADMVSPPSPPTPLRGASKNRNEQ